MGGFRIFVGQQLGTRSWDGLDLGTMGERGRGHNVKDKDHDLQLQTQHGIQLNIIQYITT